MSNGVICFANNNGKVDYIKQAVFLAKRVKQHLNLPTSIITSTPNLITDEQKLVFDNIIKLDHNHVNIRKYSDGALHHQKLEFKNLGRHRVFDLTPYENTLVMDTDYVLCNNTLLHAFDMSADFMIYKNAVDLSSWRLHKEFEYINDKGIPFYWATVFFFRKTIENKIFFDLMNHIASNWNHYSKVYDLASRNFRNDHLFSIAIHQMNGFTDNTWAKELPGKMYFILDQDRLEKIDNDKLICLVGKKDRKGEYTIVSTNQTNVHVMNKFSFERAIDV